VLNYRSKNRSLIFATRLETHTSYRCQSFYTTGVNALKS